MAEKKNKKNMLIIVTSIFLSFIAIVWFHFVLESEGKPVIVISYLTFAACSLILGLVAIVRALAKKAHKIVSILQGIDNSLCRILIIFHYFSFKYSLPVFSL
jgi:hypothetical protein